VRARLVLVFFAIVAGVVAVPAQATTETGPCRPVPDSPRCTLWTGTATFVADGDTIDVDVYGDGTRQHRRIRLTGINAPELRSYSHRRSRRHGECHAVAATNRLETLIRRGHRRVRLKAQHRRSHSGARLRRQVSVQIAGSWVDLDRVMLEEGRALFLGNNREWAWNRRYLTTAELAAAQGARIWNPSGCGPGPASSVAPRMKLRYNARGNDYRNVNGEWVRIFNPTGVRLRLRGWWFRDSWKQRYHFPRNVEVRPHGSIKLRMGRGHNRKRVLHWGRRTPPFENPHRRGKGGDGAYLFDPRGNLRAWVMYPCFAGAAGLCRG
jgi:endonuclease YncB( thermonuclease family)